MGLPEILVALAVVILVFGIYRLKKVGLELPPNDPWVICGIIRAFGRRGFCAVC